VLSFVVGLAGLRISRRFLAQRLHGSWSHYLVSLGLVAAIGGGLEALQFVLPGTPAMTDWVHDVLGGLALVLLALSVDPRTLPRASRSPVGRWLLRGTGFACLVVSLIPMLATAYAAVFQRCSFPRLTRFDSVWGRHFVEVDDGASLSMTSPPIGFASSKGTRVAKAVFAANGSYPKLELTGPLGDWTTYRILAFDVYSPASTTVSLALRVHDREHRFEYEDRFNTELAIHPGDNSIAIPLEAIRAAPVGRRMDMTAIASVLVFVSRPPDPLTLYFDDFRLER
jgi:hypothetical protein